MSTSAGFGVAGGSAQAIFLQEEARKKREAEDEAFARKLLADEAAAADEALAQQLRAEEEAAQKSRGSESQLVLHRALPQLIKPIAVRPRAPAPSSSPTAEAELSGLVQNMHIGGSKPKTAAASASSQEMISMAICVEFYNMENLPAYYLGRYKENHEKQIIRELLQVVACKIEASKRGWLYESTKEDEACQVIVNSFFDLPKGSYSQLVLCIKSMMQPGTEQSTDMTAAELSSANPVGIKVLSSTLRQQLLVDVNGMVRKLLTNINNTFLLAAMGDEKRVSQNPKTIGTGQGKEAPPAGRSSSSSSSAAAAAASSSSSSSSRTQATAVPESSEEAIFTQSLNLQRLSDLYLRRYDKAQDTTHVLTLLRVVACKIEASKQGWLQVSGTHAEAVSIFCSACQHLTDASLSALVTYIKGRTKSETAQFIVLNEGRLYSYFSMVRPQMTSVEMQQLLANVNTTIKTLFTDIDREFSCEAERRVKVRGAVVARTGQPPSNSSRAAPTMVRRPAESSYSAATNEPSSFAATKAATARATLNGDIAFFCEHYFSQMLSKRVEAAQHIKLLLQALACRIEGRANQLLPSSTRDFEKLFHKVKPAFNKALSQYAENDIQFILTTLRQVVEKESLQLTPHDYSSLFTNDVPERVGERIRAANQTVLLLGQGLAVFHFHDTNAMMSKTETTQTIFNKFLDQFVLIQHAELRTYLAHLLIITLAKRAMIQVHNKVKALKPTENIPEITGKLVVEHFTQQVDQLMSAMQSTMSTSITFRTVIDVMKSDLLTAAAQLMRSDASFIANRELAHDGPFDYRSAAPRQNYKKQFIAWRISEFAKYLEAGFKGFPRKN